MLAAAEEGDPSSVWSVSLLVHSSLPLEPSSSLKGCAFAPA